VKRLVPFLILLVLLPYFGPLAVNDGCELHGRGCVHGSSCPAAQRHSLEKAAICHTGGDASDDEEVKRYRCSISSCHGEDASLQGPDMPFILSLSASIEAAAVFRPFPHESRKRVDFPVAGPLEPPESLSFS